MSLCDCSEKCKSKEHGDLLNGAITKREVTDAELCAYINQICFCCESVRDTLGRTALHVAASVGRVNVVKWLLRRKQININARDFESGLTALHRSIFYGKINAAVALLNAGASNVLDHENLTCLDHAMKNHPFSVSHYGPQGDVYVWGINSNYIFGIQQARETPDIWDMFHKEYPFELVKQINLGKFHCVVVSKKGVAYSCGHGQGGRLGLGSEQTVLTPKPIKFADPQRQSPIHCIRASIARDHTIFLTECDDMCQLWSCGLNTHHVLGINPPPQKQLAPKRLNLKHVFDGVCAARYHSVAWSLNSIYTWGLHGGQLGHDKNSQKYISTPKLVTRLYKMKSDIREVVVSSGATVVLSETGDIFILHEYQCTYIHPRQKLLGISVVGGQLNTSLDPSLLVEKNSELKIVALSLHGKILLWQESDPHLARCTFSLNRDISVVQIYMNMCEILFVDSEGEAFQGTIKNRKKKTPETSMLGNRYVFYKFLDKDECHFIKITKLPRIHRAVSITSDSKGGNFAVIQANPKARLTGIPEPTPGTLISDLKHLLLEESDEDDYVHDIIFKVGYTVFACHRYIIASCSPTLSKLLTNEKIFEVKDTNPSIFKELLFWIYTGDCSLINLGPCPKHLLKLTIDNSNGKLMDDEQINENDKQNKNNKENVSHVRDAVRLLQDLAKKFEFVDLEKRLSKLTIRNENVEYSKEYNDFFYASKKSFNRLLFDDLYDVSIIAKGEHVIKAHKCILVARVDFFQKLYSTRWNTKAPKKDIQIHYPKNVVEIFLEYIYTDIISNPKSLDLDTLCSLIILSDEYFVIRLREICEITLCNLLSFKNAVQLLNIASMYNAEKLKKITMKFVCLHLYAFLEAKVLENLDDDLLEELTNFYCNFNVNIQNRIITPYSAAPSDETIRNVSNMYPISLDIDDEFESKNKSTPKTQRRRLKSHKATLNDAKTYITERDENEESFNNWDEMLQVTEGVDYESRIKSPPIPDRIKAITKAHNEVHDSNEYNYVNLTALNLDSSSSGFETSVDDFPTLSSPNTSGPSTSFSGKSPGKSERFDRHKLSKMSQKQRKRLSSENSSKDVQPQGATISESPKNPWKINELTSPIGSPIEQETSLSAIVMEEKKQRENFNKMIAKPLTYTQIEDKAIEDLQKFYNSSNCHEEIITTERVASVCMSVPVWVHKTK